MRGSVRVAGKKKKSGNKSAAADSSGVIASGALPG
jgi:hypothetical protein